MAFGFDTRVGGLVVERRGTPAGFRRYLAAFAAAYADHVATIGNDMRTITDGKRTIADDLRTIAHDDESGTVAGEEPLLFSLDADDARLAATLGARFVPCFPDPSLAWTDDDSSASTPATPIVRERVPLRRVCLFGPESTGKSTLAAALAARYRTLHVTEYVRGYLDVTRSQGTLEDVPWIARGQRAAAIATEERCARLVVSDTNLATVLLWSEFLFGTAPEWLTRAAALEQFDLWLVTDIDVPFEPDPQRCFPDAADRARLMAACRGMLDRLGITGLTLSGSHDARMATASVAIDALLAQRPG